MLISLIYGSHISPFIVIGHVDFFGNLTGDSIAFIYPDLKHVLLGTFTKGTVYIYWNRKLIASVVCFAEPV